MSANPFIPQQLVGRRAELHQICHILESDGDLLLAGVPGSGRRTLLHTAAQTVGARVIEIDCLRATDSTRFLQLLAESIVSVFQLPAELALIQRWSADRPLILEPTSEGRVQLTWHLAVKDEWLLFQSLLTLPQVMAEWLNCRVVLVFMNFPHIRSWDRSEKWQRYLLQEIQAQTRVSYALIATFAETWAQHSDLQVVLLGPLKNEDLQPWIVSTTTTAGLALEPDALALFLDYVQGHVGDAIALLRRIWLDQKAQENREDGEDTETRRRGDAESEESYELRVKSEESYELRVKSLEFDSSTQTSKLGSANSPEAKTQNSKLKTQNSPSPHPTPQLSTLNSQLKTLNSQLHPHSPQRSGTGGRSFLHI